MDLTCTLLFLCIPTLQYPSEGRFIVDGMASIQGETPTSMPISNAML